jgi:hypothetical protein
MAVWQFVIDFVPEQFLLDTYSCIPATMLPEDRKKGGFFRRTCLGINKLLPYLQPFGSYNKASWDGTRLYQGEAENDAVVYFNKETGMVKEVSCRIDVRQPYESFIYGIVTLATAFDCQLMARGSRQLFAPTVSDLRLAMEQSNAQKFIADPLKFLTDLSKDDKATPPTA